MANPRSSKRTIEKARQERSAAKRDRRQGRAGDEHLEAGDPGLPPLSEEQLIAALAELQSAYAAETISFEEFDERRSELMARVDVR